MFLSQLETGDHSRQQPFFSWPYLLFHMQPLEISKYRETLLNSDRLSLFRLLKQNTINRLAYKQQTSTSRSFGGWAVQDKKPSDLLVRIHFLVAAFICKLSGGRFWGSPWGLYYKGTDPISEGSARMTGSPLTDPMSQYRPFGGKISTYEFYRGTNIQSLVQMDQKQQRQELKPKVI